MRAPGRSSSSTTEPNGAASSADVPSCPGPASPLLRAYLGSLDNPELIIYRFVPSRVRYMREWALEYFEVPFTVEA